MPNPSLQDAIKEAYASCPTNVVILDTLEVRQTGVQSSLFIVRGKSSIDAADENGDTHTFQPVGFKFTLPASNEEGFRSLNLSIDNVGRTLSDFIAIAKTEKVSVEVVYRPYMSDDFTAPQMIPPLVFWLKDIQITPMQVNARATFMDLVNKKFPSELYNRSRFPALE